MRDSETWQNRSEQPKIVPINSNTSILDGSGFNISVEKIIASAPEKIKRRTRINKLGLNGLATTIIPPESVGEINESSLKKILDYSNKVNQEIGLPETNDLIIRSSSPSFFHPVIRKVQEKSEPALLVRNVYGNMSCKYFGNGTNSPSSLDDFLNSCGNKTFLLIHDDNYLLQTQALHGSVYQGKNNTEFYFRTGSLQAREFGNPDDGYPTLRVNARNILDIEKVNAAQVIKASETNSVVESSTMSVRTTSCLPHQAERLVYNVQQNIDLVLNAYEQTKSSFGERSTMEYRLYQSVNGWIGQKLHVLDVDS